MHHPAIQFVAPYRIYVPDHFFEVKTADGVARVKAIPLPPIHSAGTTQAHGPNVEIIHDIFGFAGRTKFFVVLDQQVDLSDSTWKKKVCDQDHAIVDVSLRVVNRMLEVYRDRDINRIGVRSFHALPLVRGDLSDVVLVVVDDDLNKSSDFSVTWPGFRTVGFGDAVLRDESVASDIEMHLKQSVPIPIHRELMSSARNYLWRGQYRLVPVEANTAFETFSLLTLMQVDPNNGLPDTSDIYTKLTSLQTAISSIVVQKAKPPVVWFNSSLLGWKGLLNPELLQWHTDCYSLRNKVIHRGYNLVQQAEAKASIDATNSAMNYVEALLA